MTCPVLIVIPCLNEVRTIGPLLDQFHGEAEALDAMIVVVDGGSSDGTQALLAAAQQRLPRLHVIHNPKRLQSAAINLAVARFAGKKSGPEAAAYLIRIDAHGSYPPGYCQSLLAEAEATGADAVVVPMRTVGKGWFQRATAAAQNSRLGTGGSKHRMGAAGEGQWVDHGHHALMRIAAFRAVGGYDEGFSHNEDAELDYRLTSAGFRIWLTGETRMTYYPRATARALWRQYFGYGKGRAATVLKHRLGLKPRQMLPLLVVPSAALALLVPLWWPALLPLLCWGALCSAVALWMAIRAGDFKLALAALPAMIMHGAWSAGFWTRLLRGGSRGP